MPLEIAVAAALPASGAKRGGVNVAVQPKLTGALPGIRRFFETYPFVCLEQKTSKSVGLKDAKLWATVANTLPTYLDGDGLASYFPPRADDPAHGSDRLTAYVLAATHEAGFELPAAARDQRLPLRASHLPEGQPQADAQRHHDGGLHVRARGNGENDCARRGAFPRMAPHQPVQAVPRGRGTGDDGLVVQVPL